MSIARQDSFWILLQHHNCRVHREVTLVYKCLRPAEEISCDLVLNGRGGPVTER